MDVRDLENQNREYREEIERILEDNNYLENYLYAEYVITTFINYDKNYQKGRFFRAMLISNKTFKYCEEVIRFLNPSLYQEYLEAVKKSQEKKKYNMETNINLIARGIEIGQLPDGSKYDFLAFYKFIPFRESCLNFVHDLKKFMRESDGLIEGAYDTITKYMKENNITVIVFVTENYILRNKAVFGGAEIVTPKVVHNCFRYMHALGLPNIEAVFKIVLKRYLNGEIDFGNLTKMENKFRKRNNEESYHNPYKLELKNEFIKGEK